METIPKPYFILNFDLVLFHLNVYFSVSIELLIYDKTTGLLLKILIKLLFFCVLD